MTPKPVTPDDFARLLALPEDHPERRALAGNPAFEARLRLWREFESGADDRLSPEAIDSAARELTRRLARGIDTGATAHATGTRPARAPGTFRWLGWFGSPPRAALAFASVIVVIAAATWVVTRQASQPVVRSAPEHAVLEIAAPRVTRDGIELQWAPVAGADAYQVTFYGRDLTEIAHSDPTGDVRLVLRAGQLPHGLEAGREVLAEVSALHGSDTIARSAPRLVTPP